MIILQAKAREGSWKKGALKEKEGHIPAILYGPATKAVSLSVERKPFEKVFAEAGESTLVSLKLDKKEAPVFVYDVQRDPLNSSVTHIDFYQPALDKKIEIMVPLMFEGEPPAAKELGGTLIKNIHQVEVRALPQDLPHTLTVIVTKLVTFDDRVLVSDIVLPQNVEIIGHNITDIVAQVVAPQKVEEELATPIEEKVEDVEKIEKPKKEEVPEEEAPAK